MELKLYDTLTREKRTFVPIDPNNVRMYVCGPTVYDFAHIGNARPVIVFDVLFRLLRHLYGDKHVTYVRNITDVDDKINARAARDYPGVDLNQAIRKVTEVTEAQFQADVNALGCLPPTHQPRATEFVLPRSDGRTDMKSMIQELLDRGNAYVAEGTEGKEVLFDVSSMPDYGALSGRNLEDQKAGARIAVDAHKNNPGDFVLWKESGAKEPGWKGEFVPDPRSGYDAEFKISSENASRLGRNSRVVTIHGRPGWHIECSAMSAAYLGDVFDIHGGGLDLIFPHHENEIAQSRCAHGTPVMANYWMHNGFLQVEGEKMSKSLGNFVTIAELLKTEKFGGREWSGWVVRLAMLMTHYRQPIDWTVARCTEAEIIWESWISALAELEHWDFDPQPSPGLIDPLLNDLDISGVMTILHEEAKQARQDIQRAEQFARDLLFLGLIPRIKRTGDYVADANAYIAKIKKYSKNVGALDAFRLAKKNFEIDKVNAMIDERLLARKAKDFAESDRIRDELAAMGVVLKDSKDGTTWEVAR